MTVKGATKDHPLAETAELLAYMYDRSLDVFAPHRPPSPLSLYPNRATAVDVARQPRPGAGAVAHERHVSAPAVVGRPHRRPAEVRGRLRHRRPGAAGRGARGLRTRRSRRLGTRSDGQKAARSDTGARRAAAAEGALAKDKKEVDALKTKTKQKATAEVATRAGREPPAPVLRSNFSETAFWQPHLLTGADGSATIEFTVPDSVTSWNVWVHAVTRDLRGGSREKETRAVKDLMVRPYVPRFLREGDKAEIKVVVNNASDKRALRQRSSSTSSIPTRNTSLLAAFGLGDGGRDAAVHGEAGRRHEPHVPRDGPERRGRRRVQGDGDRRRRLRRRAASRAGPAGPDAPRRSRASSRSRTRTAKTLRFDDLAKDDDPTLVNEQMVVTVDAQLFYTVLQALPVSRQLPVRVHGADAEPLRLDGHRLERLQGLSGRREDGRRRCRSGRRRSRRWDAPDPNRKMALEETPWLVSRSGRRRTDIELDQRPRPARRAGEPRVVARASCARHRPPSAASRGSRAARRRRT